MLKQLALLAVICIVGSVAHADNVHAARADLHGIKSFDFKNQTATEKFENAVALDCASKAALDNLVIAYQTRVKELSAEGKWLEALKVLDKLIAIRPLDETYANRAVANLMLRKFQSALNDEEKSGVYRNSVVIGFGLLGLNKSPEAIAQFSKYEKLSAQDLLGLSIAYDQMGETIKSKDYLHLLSRSHDSKVDTPRVSQLADLFEFSRSWISYSYANVDPCEAQNLKVLWLGALSQPSLKQVAEKLVERKEMTWEEAEDIRTFLRPPKFGPPRDTGQKVELELSGLVHTKWTK